ncbi:Holliday junction resolvase RuvX [Guyparkeria halophila]|uniref:Putative pre-16S rRNA nuclease n=1 Tax=Guyparkeria halophila TaxID=47960 RepID=A0ABZ0YT18_9GAMM|nr:Holliday junction resolvase RuvX [Guyparkeria halophila]WQH15299.1 Holliday junction resolvase RuvX [Guyparkeria halophila]
MTATQPDSPVPGSLALGFDYGEWRIGIAVGDRRLDTGRPLTTLHNRNADQIDWAAIEALIEEWRPDVLVLGWPIDDAGRCYPQAAAIRRFGNRLRERYRLPVFVVDERLSSEQATERLLNRRGRRAIERDQGQIDAMAAAVILDTFFDQSAPRSIETVTKAEVTQNLVGSPATTRH